MELALTRAYINVTNPWTGVHVAIDPAEVTPEKLEAMAPLMDEASRERAHAEHPDDPASFWRRYVELVGPDAAGALWFS